MATCKACGKPLEEGAAFCPRCGTPRGQARPADTMIGRTVIGQYVIKQRLGEGGMGAVYLADQPSVGRTAVVKVMHPSLSADPAVAPRFEVEARAASQLNHPHIITIYNYGAMEDGTLFLAMEHVDGPSLEDVLAEGPVPPGRVAAIGAQICDALGEAHRKGVVHRDLKPSNIMLARVGRQQDFVKVLDFGIAKVEGVKMTRTGSVIGTPQYMSPEQLRGDALDGRADLYALGCILYQLASGDLPFRADTAAGYMHKHLNEPVTSPALHNPGANIPPNLDAVILRSLAKDPAERFPDADTMGRALELCRDGGGVPLTAQGPAARPVGAPASRRVGLWVALGGSVAVLLAAAVTVALLYGSRREPQPPPAQKVAWQPVDEPGEAAQPVKEAVVDAGRKEPEQQAPAASKSQVARAVRPRGARRRPPRRRAQDEGAAPSKAKRSSPVALAMNRDPGGDGVVVPPRQRSAGSGRYTNMSADQLEKALKRVLANAKIAPSSKETLFNSYRQALSAWPAAQQEENRRRWLVNLLVAYNKPSLQFARNERKSLSELKRIFLAMKTKANLSDEQRNRILDSSMRAYDGSSVPVKDRPFYKRLALLQLIKNMAADPGQALR